MIPKRQNIENRWYEINVLFGKKCSTATYIPNALRVIINKEPYGALYNGYVMEAGKLAPKGWHIPADAEWTELVNFLIENGFNHDGSTSGNKIAKSLAAQNRWNNDDKDGAVGKDSLTNNKSGFAALPCGAGDPHDHYSRFDQFGSGCFWWSATPLDQADSSYYRYLFFNSNELGRNFCYLFTEMSVRCLKDN